LSCLQPGRFLGRACSLLQRYEQSQEKRSKQAASTSKTQPEEPLVASFCLLLSCLKSSQKDVARPHRKNSLREILPKRRFFRKHALSSFLFRAQATLVVAQMRRALCTS
jgi:hypothetical protein